MKLAKDYLHLTIEELLEEREFVAWLLRGNNRREWNLFLTEHPEFLPKVIKARKILSMLEEPQEHLGEEDLLKIWKNIERYDNQIKIKSRSVKRYSIMRYAAILLLSLSIGRAGYWVIFQSHKTYSYTTSLDSGSVKQSRLLLANGKTVNLEKEDSKIALNSDQKIVIDNEKVIDLTQSNGPDESKMNEVVIPFGKRSQLLLEDGTKVWLNAGSRLAFPTKFNKNKREVFLDGEAYFEVAHNRECPFLVNTSEISIKVLGTKFNISAYSTDKLTETVLLEGKVSVRELSALGFLKGEKLLYPNQRASYDLKDRSLTIKNDPDAELSVAWTAGWFKFSQQSLDEVINKLQRYYNIHFVFDSGFSTTDLISGKLDLKDSVEKVMIVLADVADIQFRIEGNQIYIHKKVNELLMRK